jgi:hypothetical protein
MMAVPGFPTYTVIYELADVDVARSDAFLDAKGRGFADPAVDTIMSVTMSDVMRMDNPGSEAGPPAQAMMVVSMTPQRDIVDTFHEWYDTVHLAELLSCPGFQRARRYRSLEGIPNFFAFYDLDQSEALKGERFVGFSTRKFDELPAIQQKVGPNSTSNMCDVYRRLG